MREGQLYKAGRQTRAGGTVSDRRIILSRVSSGVRWTMLVAAMSSCAGSLMKSRPVDCRQIATSSHFE